MRWFLAERVRDIRNYRRGESTTLHWHSWGRRPIFIFIFRYRRWWRSSNQWENIYQKKKKVTTEKIYYLYSTPQGERSPIPFQLFLTCNYTLRTFIIELDWAKIAWPTKGLLRMEPREVKLNIISCYKHGYYLVNDIVYCVWKYRNHLRITFL